MKSFPTYLPKTKIIRVGVQQTNYFLRMAISVSFSIWVLWRIKIIALILSRGSHKVGQKWKIPEENLQQTNNFFKDGLIYFSD